MAVTVAFQGPVAVAVDASTWMLYTGGVMTECTYQELDHAVNIVGYSLYDNSTAIPYWTLKNFWGTSWGENGYIRVQYGTNQCGIKTRPSISIGKK